MITENNPSSAGAVLWIALFGPMPLSLESQALTYFLEGGFHLPAPHEPRDDPLGVRLQIGAEEGLGFEPFVGIADQNST